MRLGLLLLVVGCGGNPGGTGQTDDTWTLEGEGAVTAVPLSVATPTVSFMLRGTLHHEGEVDALSGAVALTLNQPADLATHAVDWPLRNQFCLNEDPSGFCPRFVKWQAFTPEDGSCDGAGTCTIAIPVTVSAVDAASLPADLSDLFLTASGYLNGPALEPMPNPEPPPGTTLVFTFESI
jgi:hypothetical protein